MDVASNTLAHRLLVASILAMLAAPALATGQGATDAPPSGEGSKRERMNKEVDEAVDAIRAYTIEQRDEAQRRAQESMKAIDERIVALQADMDQRRNRMDDSARLRSQAAMDDLRQRRQRLSEWNERMRDTSGKAWADVKRGFLDSYHELSEALRKAQSEFDREAGQDKDGDGKGDAMSAFRVHRDPRGFHS